MYSENIHRMTQIKPLRFIFVSKHEQHDNSVQRTMGRQNQGIVQN